MNESVAARLADGQWHRLHPATPLLRGGIALVAIIGVVLVNLRDVVIDLVIGGPQGSEPLVWLLEEGYAGLGLLAVALGLVLFIGGFYVSWRMHTFRITNELVEVRSGVLFRTNRRGRLDRIQGINIVRPFLARVFGAAKLEVTVAGEDASIQLAYLGSGAADELRREILLLASGTQAAASDVQGDAQPGAGTVGGGIIERRIGEFLAPERAPDVATLTSVVAMHPGRLIGSILLSTATILTIVAGVGLAVMVAVTGRTFLLFGFVPAIIGVAGFYISRFSRSLRYSIAGTPDGVRVGFGLLTTSNETLPPGRIHAVQVSQSILWRAAGWWEVKINRAAGSSTSGAAGQANTTILPVGTLADVRRVLELIVPDLIDEESAALLERGMLSPGGDDGYTNSPPRAVALRWFSWRRNGFATAPGVVLFRRGRLFRELIIVPQARIQSMALSQGPLQRRLRLATLRLHTVPGPIDTRLGAIDDAEAVRFFGALADASALSASADTSHRWRSTAAEAADA